MAVLLSQECLPILGHSEPPDLKLKSSKPSLSISGVCDAGWIQKELKAIGPQPLADSTESENADLHAGVKDKHILAKKADAEMCVPKLEIMTNADKALMKAHHDEEKEEDVSIVHDTSNLEQDTCGPFSLVALLKSCSERNDLCQGSRIHTSAVERGLLKTNVFVGSSIVNMYAKCGALAKAQEVFNELPVRNIVSWNALIAGYVHHKRGEDALYCLEQMQHEGLSPDKFTLSCILKACGSAGVLEKGQEVHAMVVKEGLLEEGAVIGNALTDMYIKCGLLEKALEVFDELPTRDVVTWTALITGYALQGHGEEALKCFERMHHEECSPNAPTFLGVLKACICIRAVHKGQEVHAEIISDGLLEKDIVVGSALVDMYAKCGLLLEAQDVFDELPVRDALLWSTLIDGYSQNMQGQEALNCFEQMQFAGFVPDGATIASVLKVCGSLGALDKGQELHNQMVRAKSFGKDIVVANALIGMYAKCGHFEKALEVFHTTPSRDIISWNALISGYVQHGHVQDALNIFERMQSEGLCPDTVTSACLLKACGNIGTLERGQRLHAVIVREGLLEKDIVVANALVDMYIKCGFLEKAEDVFDQLKVRDVISWNCLIAGHVQYSQGEEALNCFQQMQVEGLSADAVTYASALKACASIGAADKGQEIHDQILREGLMEKSLMVPNSLIDMYAKCGFLGKAQEVFNKLSTRDIVSWNALIAGYSQHGHGEKALEYFEKMQGAGLSADCITFVCILKACGSIGAAEKGQELHVQISKDGSLEKDVLIGTALVDMYAKCGLLEKAREVFDKLPQRDVVSWNALVTGYANHALGEEVLDIFDQMHFEGSIPDVVTFVGVLKACGSIGAICKGQEMHTDIVKRGWLEKDGIIGSALVDMYASCGMPTEAHKTFDKLPFSNIVTWNALIAGYALLGKDEQLFSLVQEMARKGNNPDSVTFIIVLNMCSHGGLLDKGQMYYELMSLSFNIFATIKHNTCIVDLFARAGQLDKAVAVIQKLSIHVDATMWHALLGACQMSRNMKLGALAFEHAAQLDVMDASSYVSLSNIYATSHRSTMQTRCDPPMEELHYKIANSVLGAHKVIPSSHTCASL